MPFRKRQTELAESSVRLKFVKTLRVLAALWKDFPKDLHWSEAAKDNYVLMFHCNGRWYKFNAQLHGGSAPLVGELVLQYKGNNYFDGNMIELAAGTNEVSLMARDVKINLGKWSHRRQDCPLMEKWLQA